MLLASLWCPTSYGTAAALERTSDHPGYAILRQAHFLPADFDEETFADLWKVWPEPEQSQVRDLPAAERRRQMMSYYGLVPAPDDVDGTQPALGYSSDIDGGWTMTCLACHGGQVAGQIIPGLPNSQTALQTLTEDVRATKLKQQKPLAHLDLGSLRTPLNMTNGTTNAVIFGVVLGAYRRPDMSVDFARRPPAVVHHDVDAPPFWNVRKKTSLYADGFAPKTHRPLMQFMLLPTVTKETVYGWEDDVAQILQWIESLEPPKYPFAIDQQQADRGRVAFEKTCSRCHGTYGPDGTYEQQTIPIEEIATDRVRFDALMPAHRQWMKDGWMSRYGADPVEVNPVGYVAPPLDGIWASGPYFHNGSVPTLWHVLHPTERPTLWKRSAEGYDQLRVGLEVEAPSEIPSDQQIPARRRRYFDTRLPGKSAVGHDYPDELSPAEKAAVLEYLKTL